MTPCRMKTGTTQTLPQAKWSAVPVTTRAPTWLPMRRAPLASERCESARSRLPSINPRRPTNPSISIHPVAGEKANHAGCAGASETPCSTDGYAMGEILAGEETPEIAGGELRQAMQHRGGAESGDMRRDDEIGAGP